MPVPLSTDQYLADADKRLTKQDAAQEFSDKVGQNAQKWFDAYEELPKNDEDLNNQVVSMLNTTEARKAFHEKVREKFFSLPEYKSYKQAVEGGDEATKAILAPKYKEYFASQMPAYKQAELDKQRVLVGEKRKALEDTIGTFIKSGGTLNAAEDIPTNETPEQKAAVNAGLAYNKTFPQALEETKKSKVFQGMSNATAAQRWGGEGPTFKQQEDLDKAIAAEDNPEFKAVLQELQSNWKRERVGSPTYQNGFLDTIQRAVNLSTVPAYAVGKTLQDATSAQREEEGTTPTTVYGVNPSLAAKNIANHPVDTAKKLITNALTGVKESVLGSTDSSANIGGLVAESNKQSPRNEEFVGTGFGTNPKLMQDITQTLIPNPFALEAKAIGAAGKVIGTGLGAAKDLVAGTEVGARAISKAEEATQVVRNAFTRNLADKQLGKAYGIAKGDEEAGQKLGQTLEAAKEYGIGQREKFLAEKTGAPSYAAQVVQQESAGEHAFLTLNKAGLAKGTNSLAAADRTAKALSEADGIPRVAVSNPEVVRAYSKMVGKEVSHVVMPEQYAQEMRTIVGAADQTKSLLNNKSEIVRGAVKAADFLNKEIYQPINNTTRNFYLARPSTSFRNLIGNSELLGTMDPATYKPEVVGQIAKHFGGRITNAAERAKPAITNAEGKSFSLGEVNDWIHNYGLAADTGRFGARTSGASKLNPLRYTEKASSIISTPAYEASQAGDTGAKIALALSEMKRVKDLGPEASGQILKHVENVMGLYSRMNSSVDKVGKTATFAYSWNGAVLPNLLRQGLKENGKGLQSLYRVEELKQAYGQKNAKDSDRPALLSTAIGKFDADKVFGKQSKIDTAKGSKENVLSGIETPLSTPSQFFQQGSEDSIKNAAPLGVRTIVALITGVDPETDKSIDKDVRPLYTKDGAVDAIEWAGDRAKLAAYTATGPSYKAFKDLYYLFKTRNEPNNMIDAAIKLRSLNAMQPLSVFAGATPGVSDSIAKPRYQENKTATDKAKVHLDRYNFKQKAKVEQ